MMKKGWEIKVLGDVCGISSVLIDPRLAKYEDMLHVGGANIESATGSLIELKTAKEEGLKSGKFVFNDSTVLYSKIRPYLMKVSRPDFLGLCSADIYPLSPDPSVLDRGYLFHHLLSPAFTDFAISGSARAGMPKVNRDHLFTYQLPLPPLAEQQRIVRLLDEAFEGIATAKANAAKNLKNARALFESHLQSVFSQGAQSAVEGRGNEWVEKHLEKIGKTQTGSTPRTSDQSQYGDFISFVKPGDFNPDGSLDYDKDGLSESGAKGARKVPAGSVLMVCIGATIGKCGYCDQDVTTNQQINALTPADGSSHRFLYYQMMSESFQRSVIHRSGQATLPIINKSKWSALSVWLPPTLAEQKHIAAKLDVLVKETQHLTTLYTRKLAALEALKKSLLHRAFSGEL